MCVPQLRGAAGLTQAVVCRPFAQSSTASRDVVAGLVAGGANVAAGQCVAVHSQPVYSPVPSRRGRLTPPSRPRAARSTR